jgi:hypothetical protein
VFTIADSDNIITTADINVSSVTPNILKGGTITTADSDGMITGAYDDA